MVPRGDQFGCCFGSREPIGEESGVPLRAHLVEMLWFAVLLLLLPSPCPAGVQSTVHLSQSMQRQDYQTGAIQPKQRGNLRREGAEGGEGGWR